MLPWPGLGPSVCTFPACRSSAVAARSYHSSAFAGKSVTAGLDVVAVDAGGNDATATLLVTVRSLRALCIGSILLWVPSGAPEPVTGPTEPEGTARVRCAVCTVGRQVCGRETRVP